MHLLAITALPGCGGDGATAPGPSIEGAWTLRSLDGDEMPAFISFTTLREAILDVELGCELWTTAGSLTVQPGGSYSWSETSADQDCDDPQDNRESTFSTTGTWVSNGGSVTIVENSSIGSRTAEGTWDANSMILTFTDTDLLGDTETTIRVYTR